MWLSDGIESEESAVLKGYKISDGREEVGKSFSACLGIVRFVRSTYVKELERIIRHLFGMICGYGKSVSVVGNPNCLGWWKIRR